jgi:hypothetical protein
MNLKKASFVGIPTRRGCSRPSTSTEDRKGGNEYDRNHNTVVVGNERPVILTDDPHSLKS